MKNPLRQSIDLYLLGICYEVMTKHHLQLEVGIKEASKNL